MQHYKRLKVILKIWNVVLRVRVTFSSVGGGGGGGGGGRGELKNSHWLAEVGTRYFKSTDGTFAVTLLKKYRRHFIRYIFEKVPTVPVLGTVIRYFLIEKFSTIWKQYFR